MQKVISINLNGNSNAYHPEASGYDALRSYLDGAAALLKDHPDRAEILSNLEQAIAETCAACLTPHKSVSRPRGRPHHRGHGCGLLYQYVPEFRYLVCDLPGIARDVWQR